MSDRKFIGLFLIGIGLVILLGPLWGSEWGKIATRCIDEVIGIGQISAGIVVACVSTILILQGIRMMIKF